MGLTGDQGNDNVALDLQSGHSSDIQNKEKKQFKCDYPDCHAVFTRSFTFRNHIRTHTGERPYKCNYPECTKSYTCSSHLKRHMETHNCMKKVYKCVKCSMLFSYSHNLKRHYKRYHSEKICKECGKTFNKKDKFVKHQAIHSASEIYKCDKCGKSYQNRSRFKSHLKMHEKRYSCSIPGCSEEFENWSLLCKHKTKHVTHYTCDTCGKVFLNNVNLKQHSAIHLADRLIFPCPYNECHKFYRTKFNLHNHVRIKHLGEKFYCDICTMGLSSKQRLKEHIQHYHEVKGEESHDQIKVTKKKKNIQKRKRKDAGVSKKSVLSTLIGLDLPHDLEKMIINRETKINDTKSEIEDTQKK
ncbi:hypothetical protein P5V15_003279 [Pogonomyrmex californicus]